MSHKARSKKTQPPSVKKCAPTRKRATDGDQPLKTGQNSVWISGRNKIRRSVPKHNYCETGTRGRRSDHLAGGSLDDNMCLELEAAAGENRGYGTRSKNLSDDHKRFKTNLADKEMALTDSDDTFSAKDEDVSNHPVVLDTKTKKTLNKSFKTPAKDSKNIKQDQINENLKTNSDCQTLENQTCPICQEILPDNHSFTLHIREHNTSNNKSHVCQICQKTLCSPSSLDRHMYVHSGERPFKCRICDLAFTTNGNMHRHMRTHLTTTTGSTKRKRALSESEKSEDEETTGPKKTVYRTSDHNSSETFKCPVCNKRFISLESLQGHMDIHPKDAIECWKCNVVSENYAGYESHTCIKPEESTVKSDMPQTENDCVVGFQDLHFIEFSATKFSLIAKTACEKQARRPSSATLVFECHICLKAFPCTRTLQQHGITHNTCVHTQALEYKSAFEGAEMCIDDKIDPDKDTFLAALDLQRVTTSSTVENSTCSKTECKENFLQEEFNNETSAADKEISNINSKQSCQAENSNDFADIPSIISLTSKATLPSMRTSPVTATAASPENDVMEPVCPDLPAIEGSANSSFEDSLYQPSCSYRVSDTHSASNKGEPFPCKHCSSSFRTMKALKSHSRSHSQKGPHFCAFCTYKSVDKSTLLRHMRTHNGERPFKCSLCDQAFTTKANSHRHVRKRHSLPADQVADAVVYNTNMIDTNSSENVSNENDGETVCKYCGKDFKFVRVLRHHLRAVSNSCAKKPYACKECSFGFSTKNNCIRHIKHKLHDFKDNVHELVVIKPLTSNDQQKQSAMSSNNEATTEEDEPLSLHIVESESNHSNEETNLNDYNSSSYDQHQEENGNHAVNFQNQSMQEQENVTENTACDIANDQHNSCSTEDDRVSIAQSLVSLSEGLTFQVAPLDLSVRAIDLSSKSAVSKSNERPFERHIGNSVPNSFKSPNEGLVVPQPAHSSPAATRTLVSENPLNAPVSPINLVQKDGSKAAACQQPSITALPLIYVPQTMTASAPSILNTNAPPNSTLYISNAVCLPVNNEKTDSQNACMSQMKMVKKKLVSNERSYKCEYCDGKFTLKSNRERHVKKQHPKFARPARSRNFIPHLPDGDILKQIPNVSDATKTLLRSVLIPKVNSSSPTVKHNENEDMAATPVIKNESVFSPLNENMQITEREDFLMDMNSRNDFENNDLASVSSVIDTANSQVIKKYLTDANISDLHPSPRKAVSSSESEAEDYNRVAQRLTSEKNHDPLKCETCGHKFPWESALQRHRQTHTGERPYRCSRCPVIFSTKSNLDRHVKKKCCDKGKYEFHKGQSTKGKSANLKNGFQHPHHSENSLENTSNDSHHAIDEQQCIADTNGLSLGISNNLTCSTFFNPSLNINTVAHEASLRLQGYDFSQSEFECRFCKNTYKTTNDLENHMEELHPFQYQSLIGKEGDHTEDTIISWRTNFNITNREYFDKHEGSLIQNQPLSLTPAAEPNLSSISTNSESEIDAENNLIMNLLGVKDSKVIDKIIDCAARTRVEQET